MRELYFENGRRTWVSNSTNIASAERQFGSKAVAIDGRMIAKRGKKTSTTIGSLQTKDEITKAINSEIAKHEADYNAGVSGAKNTYWGSEEDVNNSNAIFIALEENFGYNWENDDEASHYFAKATSEEILKYTRDIILPKLNNKAKAGTKTAEKDHKPFPKWFKLHHALLQEGYDETTGEMRGEGMEVPGFLEYAKNEYATNYDFYVMASAKYKAKHGSKTDNGSIVKDDNEEIPIEWRNEIKLEKGKWLICLPQWNRLEKRGILKSDDNKNAKDWRPANKSTNCKWVDSGSPYGSRYMYSPLWDQLRYQDEGEWYSYGSVSDTFSNGGGVGVSVLVWIDNLEKFYQMPLPVWKEFKEKPAFKKLEEIGYSDYYSNDKNEDLKFSDAKTNEVSQMEKDLGLSASKEVGEEETIKVCRYHFGRYSEEETIKKSELADMIVLGDELDGFDIREEDEGKEFFASESDIDGDQDDDEGYSVSDAYAVSTEDIKGLPQFAGGGNTDDNFGRSGIVEVKPKHASRDEVDELIDWLDENKWGYEQAYTNTSRQQQEHDYIQIFTKNVSREEIAELKDYLESQSWDFANLYANGGELDGSKIGVAKRLKIKNWYIKNYPTDDLGEEINDKITFWSLWVQMSQGDDVYSILEVSDSIVRERVFEKISQILDIEYDVIYKKWLQSSKYAKGSIIKGGGNTDDGMKRISEHKMADGGSVNTNDLKVGDVILYKTFYPITFETDYKQTSSNSYGKIVRISQYGNKSFIVQPNSRFKSEKVVERKNVLGIY